MSSWKMPRIYWLSEGMVKTHRILCKAKNRELHDFTGHPVQFDWRMHQGHTTTQILQEIKKMMAEKIGFPSEFQGRIIFMSMFNDIEQWTSQKESTC